MEKCVSKFESDTLAIHAKKLHNIGIDNEITPCDPEKVVFNYSSFAVTASTKALLAYGLEFCLPVYKINFYRYFLTTELLLLLHKIKSDMLERITFVTTKDKIWYLMLERIAFIATQDKIWYVRTQYFC